MFPKYFHFVIFVVVSLQWKEKFSFKVRVNARILTMHCLLIVNISWYFVVDL